MGFSFAFFSLFCVIVFKWAYFSFASYIEFYLHLSFCFLTCVWSPVSFSLDLFCFVCQNQVLCLTRLWFSDKTFCLKMSFKKCCENCGCFIRTGYALFTDSHLKKEELDLFFDMLMLKLIVNLAVITLFIGKVEDKIFSTIKFQL